MKSTETENSVNSEVCKGLQSKGMRHQQTNTTIKLQHKNLENKILFIQYVVFTHILPETVQKTNSNIITTAWLMQHAVATCLTTTVLYSTAAPQSHSTTYPPPHILHSLIKLIVSNENDDKNYV